MSDPPDITPDRWDRVQEIFHEALQRAELGRAVFIAEACGDDTALRDEVQSLLAAHDEGGPLGELESKPKLPDRIGQFRVLKVLGDGGMGVVYLAEREGADFKQRVALKVIRTGVAAPHLEERMRIERRILASLDHPGIARLIDGGATPDGQPYYAMEYVEGTNILDYCDEQQLTLTERLALFVEICEPVQYAHQQLIVHRDIKPNNIMVTANGRPKLLDFGIAKALEPSQGEAGATQSGAWFTPAYASPEQILGQQINTLSDVYALGILLYELLTGHRPYEVDTEDDSLERILLGHRPDPPSVAVTGSHTPPSTGPRLDRATPAAVSRARRSTPRQLRKRLSGDLDAIVLKALSKDPLARYKSVEQFADDVRRYLTGRPVSAQSGSFRYRATKFVRRYRNALVAATVLTGLLVGYGVTITVQHRRLSLALDEARIEADRSTQLTELLLGLFENPTPGIAADDRVTRELLARGLDRAEHLETRPDARAQMYAALGQVYRHLGEFAQAAPLLERAVGLHREFFGDRHLNVAEDLVALGDVYRRMNRLAEAEELLREALSIEREVLGDEHPRIAKALNDLSLVLRDAGDYAGAEPLAREALAMRRRIFGSEHPDVAESINYLAAVLRRMGDYDAAEPLYRQALEMRRRLYGGDHPVVAESINNLALQRNAIGDREGAEALYREALAMYRRLFGDVHPDVATAMGNLGIVLSQIGQFDEAEQLYRQALDIDKRVFGEGHPEVASALFSIASLLRRRGEFDEAEAAYREVLEMRRTALGEDHPQMVPILRSMGLVLRQQGKLEAAEPYLRQAVSLGREVLGSDHPTTATALNDLGIVLLAKQDYAGAEPLLLEALDVRRGLFDDSNQTVIETAQELVQLYEAWDRPEAADRYRSLTPR